MSLHAFVDESKRAGLVLAVALVPSAEVEIARKAVRGLLRPGQMRLHFTKESHPRRRLVLRTIHALAPGFWIYDASRLSGHAARDTALAAVAVDAIGAGVERLVLERDDSVHRQDLRVLAGVWRDRSAIAPDTVHTTARAEQLLALPDAAAWCWTRDAQWRAELRPLVTRVVTL